ncbi:MAG: type I-B CRISPR-associated protein Cas5 [Clostridia bacterium]|nr:type I-B CRISPR-associated protein Cas5 [Clostridia bacterium]
MKVLIFDLKGTFAHFRKIYNNSSSLSYSIPPRTTVIGIIAAVLGKERDSYYEEMSSEVVKIAVRKMSRTRKIMQSVNYIKATGPSYLVNPKDHTQIPFEIVCGDPEVRYRVYFRTDKSELYKDLKSALQMNKSVFPIYLGAAPFNGTFEWVDEGELELNDVKGEKEICTPIEVNSIEKLIWKQMQKENILIKDKMPVDFAKDRYPINTKSYIYDDRGESIGIKLKPEAVCFKVKYMVKSKKIEENIVFY